MIAKTTSIPDLEKFRKILTDKGMKATPQRMAVHRVMATLVHAGVDDVYETIHRNGYARTTRMSVYNTLMQLADAGIYARRLSSGSKMIFDAVPSPHVHMHDTASDEYKDVFDNEIIRIIEEHFKGRRWKGHRLYGIDIQLKFRPTEKKVRR